MKARVQYPESQVFFRRLSRSYPVISHGKGVYLFDREGKRYLDAVGGAFVASLGHGNPEISSKIADQLQKVAYVNGTQFTTDATLELSRRLAEYGSSLGLTRSTFLCSGSEAVEAALKLARQICLSLGQGGRTQFITRNPSYHGNTLFALSASGRPHYKEAFKPYLSSFLTIEAPLEARPKPLEFYLNKLEAVIDENGAQTIAGLVFEPIGGSSLGASIPPEGYWPAVQKICRKNGILLIADEVLTGVGRTGKFFASEHFGLKPDILVLGKGISSGYSPLSVVMTGESWVEKIRESSSDFLHAQTFMQVPSATRAGLAVLEAFEKDQILSRVEDLGQVLLQEIKKALSGNAHVGFITGKGLLVGIEWVQDQKSLLPFDRSKQIAEKMVSAAFENGLILWPNIGHLGGQGDLTIIAPPLNITKSEIKELVDLLKKTVGSFSFSN